MKTFCKDLVWLLYCFNAADFDMQKCVNLTSQPFVINDFEHIIKICTNSDVKIIVGKLKGLIILKLIAKFVAKS